MDIHPRDRMTLFGEATRGDRANVSKTEDADFHTELPNVSKDQAGELIPVSVKAGHRCLEDGMSGLCRGMAGSANSGFALIGWCALATFAHIEHFGPILGHFSLKC